MKIKRTALLIGVPVAAVGIGAGVALAAWSATGSGFGGGGARVAQSIVVTAVTPSGSGATLYPGGPAAPAYVTLQNPNPYAVTITGLAWGTPSSNNTTLCPSANIALDSGAPTTTSIPLAAGATVTALQFNGVFDLLHSAPDGCQSVTFSVPLTVSGTQQ